MWAKILQYGLGIVDKLLGNQRDNELRKDGARKGDLAQRDKTDEIRKESKVFRRKPKPDTKSGAADRLRRHKDKSW